MTEQSVDLSQLDLGSTQLHAAATEARWRTPEKFWPRIEAVTAELDPPFGVVHLPSLAFNAHDLLRRAQGTPIRVASKSIRVREVLAATLKLDGYHGVLAYTLAEANWLATDAPGWAGIDDVVVAYPSVDRAAIRAVAASEALSRRVTLMVDSIAQLDLIDSIIAPAQRNSVRVAIELDCSWDAPVLGRVGVWRSPVHSPNEALNLAQIIHRRPGFSLVGMMGYEAQIAGLANAPIGNAARGVMVRELQKRSGAELLERRQKAVALVRQVAELEFVNGGGTGSLEYTHDDPSVTEIASGSGLFGPRLFDNYAHFQPAPAASFALDVVRKSVPGIATVLGGGWIASGPPAWDRAPYPVWPQGLEYIPREGAGEVQTPLKGDAAVSLSAGSRVWFRHTKAGEISEHLNEVHFIDDDGVLGSVPTYRGEGKAFL